MSTNTSIGPATDRGGNDSPGNADGCGNKTLGEGADPQQPPEGAEVESAPRKPEAARGEQPKQER
jgi:hypothetical protein